MKGFYGSREGLFVILSYYSFFLLATMVKKDKLRNIIFIILTICGILNVLYGFLQVINCQFVFGIPVTRKWSVASGFLFNPDFMGTYMIIMVGLWLPKYLLDNTNNKGTFLLTLLFVFGILICGTMGALLTLVLIVIMLILYCFFIRRKKINLGLVCKKFIFLFVSFFILFNIVSVINDNYSNDVSNLKYELKNTLSGNIDNSFGTGRIYIWKEAFKYFSNYIYTGIGIDNFAYLGYNYGTLIYDSPSRDNPVYKAHNEFFQILFTEGIFTFATYLLFMLLIFVLSLKKVISIDNDYDVLVSFFIVFCAYLIQSFFNIRILFIAPIFFMITGFLISDVTNKKVL
ncbi:MAG: O-antigen ligase family protein [Candidatus Coprovivens sp.]